ncbi:MAG: DUF5666 domain-containing protein [Nitrospirota bacterium]
MKNISKILVSWILFALFAVTAVASESDETRSHDSYPAKFYGVIEKMPGRSWKGIWVVNGREILVTDQTKIEEKYGKAEAGAYIEVEGNYLDETFTAYEIEVRRESIEK